jgi:hypothetical protein
MIPATNGCKRGDAMPAGLATYPRRRPFFANRFCRLLTKVCLANQVGPEACFLLVTIAMTEDAKSYRGPVTFWNEQLMAVLGINNVKSLIRVRNKAIEAGWLHYDQGGKGVVGKYWVTIPPDFEGMDDTPVDENMAEYQSVSHGKNDTERAGEGQEKGRESGMDTSGKVATILPLPNPLPNTPLNPPQAGGGVSKPRAPKAEHPHFAAFWSAYPRKTAKPAASTAFARIDPDDATFAAMLAALDRQRRSADWCKDGGRFIPHPATWLNQRRWEDMPPEVSRPATPTVSSTGLPYEPYENFIPKSGA